MVGGYGCGEFRYAQLPGVTRHLDTPGFIHSVIRSSSQTPPNEPTGFLFFSGNELHLFNLKNDISSGG